MFNDSLLYSSGLLGILLSERFLFAWKKYWFADWQGISHKIAENFYT